MHGQKQKPHTAMWGTNAKSRTNITLQYIASKCGLRSKSAVLPSKKPTGPNVQKQTCCFEDYIGVGWPEGEEEQLGNVKLEEEVMKTSK